MPAAPAGTVDNSRTLESVLGNSTNGPPPMTANVNSAANSNAASAAGAANATNGAAAATNTPATNTAAVNTAAVNTAATNTAATGTGSGDTPDAGFDGLNRTDPSSTAASDSGSSGTNTDYTADMKAFLEMLEKLEKLQKEVLLKINQYRAASDEAQKKDLLAAIKTATDQIDAQITSKEFQDPYIRLKKGATAHPKYAEVFGENGRVAVLFGTQDAIRAFVGSPTQVAAPGSPTATGGNENGQGNSASAGTGAGANGNDPNTNDTANDTANGNATAGAANANASAAPPMVYVPPVPNSYSVVPMTMTDEAIRAFLDPLIDKELGKINAEMKDGMRMNRERQLIGSSNSTSVVAAGHADYDAYKEWLKAVPALRTALNAQAQALYDAQVQAQLEKAGAGSAPTPAASGNPASSAGQQ